MSLPSFSVRNPVAANLLMACILAGGLAAGAFMIREFFPAFDADAITVTVVYPGSTPEEVDRSITYQVVRELRGIEGVDEIASTSFEGASVTTLKLLQGAPPDPVVEEVRTRMDQLRASLPSGAEEPLVDRVRPFIPVITAVVFGEAGEAALRTAALGARDALLREPGISRVVVSGTREREIQVLVDPARLEEFDVTFEETGRAIAAANLDAPGGPVKSERGNIRVRTELQRDGAATLLSLPMGPVARGGRVSLSDIARVEEGFEDRIEQGRFRGMPAVLITVFKTPEQDAIEIAERVRAFVLRNRNALPAGLSLETVTDLSRFIEERLDLLIRNGTQGLLLVLLALALFLDLRIALWVAVGLPVAFLGTILAMKLAGITINMISMFGLIVVIGLLVDDAIVVAESVFKRIRSGEPARDAVVRGAGEVALPVVAAVATTMAAFAPLAFIEGRIGTFLRELPLVVMCALGMSLVECFLILPAHLAHDRKPWSPGGLAGSIVRIWSYRLALLEVWLPAIFERTLRPVLRLRYATLALFAAALMAALGLVAGGKVPFVLIQKTDAESLVVTVEMMAGTRAERTREVIEGIERMMLDTPEVAKVFSLLGTSLGDGGLMRASDSETIGQVTVELLGSEERRKRGLRNSDELTAYMRAETADIPGAARVRVQVQGGGPGGRDIEIRVSGEDAASLERALAAIREAASAYDGLTIDDTLEAGKLEARLLPLPVADRLGVAPGQVAAAVRHALFGFEAQALQRRDEELKVRVMLPLEFRRSLGDVLSLRLRTRGGDRVPLSELTGFTMVRGEAKVDRSEGRRSVLLGADVDASRANAAEVAQSLQREVLDGIPVRFPGVTTSFEGQKRQTEESFGSLKVLFPAALFLIYSVIAVLFRSYWQPLLIMVVIPFGWVGAILGHWIMGFPFTILSVIGLVALTGVIVNDNLVLISTVNRLRREGAGRLQAVVEGTKSRLRAILLTSLTTICGLAPLLLESSFQAQFLIPMAISLVFGLAAGTVLIPVLMPCLYMIMGDGERIFRRVCYRRE